MTQHTFEGDRENVIVDDNFNYQPGNLQTVSGNFWTNWNGSASVGVPINGTGGTEKYFLFGSRGVATAAVGTTGSITLGTTAKTQSATYANATNTTPLIGPVFSVSVTITPPNDTTSLASTQNFAIQVRGMGATFTDVGNGQMGTMAFMSIAPQPGMIGFYLVDITQDGSNNRLETILASVTFPNLVTVGMAMGTAATLEAWM